MSKRYEIYRDGLWCGSEEDLVGAYAQARTELLTTPGTYTIERGGERVARLRRAGRRIEAWIR